MAPRPSLVFLLTALLCLVWGSTWVVIQGGLASLPPFSSAAIRFALAAACMSGLVAVLGKREGGAAPGWRLSLVLGTLNFAGSYGIVYWSETRLPSGLVSVLWAVFPMLQATLGHFFLRGERLGLWQLAGFVLGFLGVASLFATDLTELGPGAIPAGALVLVAPTVTALGTTVSWLDGEVGMGEIDGPVPWVQLDIRATYLLGSFHGDSWRTTLRFDRFETTDRDGTAELTLDYTWEESR